MPQTPQPGTADPPRTQEEPGITQEEDVPSDGKDEHGEQMMKELGRDQPDPKLSDPQAGKP